jgi:hypothetical protein
MGLWRPGRTPHNTYQAPVCQERAVPPAALREQRGDRDVGRVLETLTSFLIDGCGSLRESSAPNTYRGSVRQRSAGAEEPRLLSALETDLCPRAGLLKGCGLGCRKRRAPASYLRARVRGRAAYEDPWYVVGAGGGVPIKSCRLPGGSRLELCARARALPSVVVSSGSDPCRRVRSGGACSRTRDRAERRGC